MLIRRETPADISAIRAVHASAFGDPQRPGVVPAEVGLVDALRTSAEWLPELSLVAKGADGSVVGHVVCSRAWVDTAPALGLGPLGVRADRQGRGIGTGLMHGVLAAADALGETLVALVGNGTYYSRFGFRPGSEYSITPLVADWARDFQVRALSGYSPAIRGAFVYAKAFDEL